MAWKSKADVLHSSSRLLRDVALSSDRKTEAYSPRCTTIILRLWDGNPSPAVWQLCCQRCHAGYCSLACVEQTQKCLYTSKYPQAISQGQGLQRSLTSSQACCLPVCPLLFTPPRGVHMAGRARETAALLFPFAADQGCTLKLVAELVDHKICTFWLYFCH